MRGKKFMSPEGIMVIGALLVLGYSLYALQTKDRVDYSGASENAKEAKALAISSDSEQKTFAAETTALLTTLSHRVEKLENKPTPEIKPSSINLNLHEPIKVQVVYRQVAPKPLVSNEAPKVAPLVKTPLMNRARVPARSSTVNQ